MQTTQRSQRCQVFLHPAASNPRTIETIQRSTGLIVIVNVDAKRAALTVPAPTSPWGGDAA